MQQAAIKSGIQKGIGSLYEFKKPVRGLAVPTLGAISVGIPLLFGIFIQRLDLGIMACMGGLVMLYLPLSASVAGTMITMITVSFGFLISYTIGLLFSFNPFVSAVAIGLTAMAVHWIKNYFALRPPGNFFFIMLISIASCQPFDLNMLPARVGLLAIGTMVACALALGYSLYNTRRNPVSRDVVIVRQKSYTNIVTSAIVGVFTGLSLLTGFLLKLDFPYWIPISCIAILQGVDVTHIWLRSFHRIVGTMVGMGLAWALLSLHMNTLFTAISMLLLQFLIEWLITRNYGVAVAFMTPMTIFLAELSSHHPRLQPGNLIELRLLDIVIGSLIGAIGGWLLYHRQLHYHAVKQLRRSRVKWNYQRAR
ncbi:MAG: FUSC family protein [Candidatus Pseudobacter hemicellulosilyticus]|uniref:FUSC family protein n=1 Tax=Candidatus Pseudobacter hemicellulosilyticus TaxID=3121375 RepID=A0AAJ5WT22_9BACT|nr:MAG: FUSC family protein [Pseudobacter sp.]